MSKVTYCTCGPHSHNKYGQAPVCMLCLAPLKANLSIVDLLRVEEDELTKLQRQVDETAAELFGLKQMLKLQKRVVAKLRKLRKKQS